MLLFIASVWQIVVDRLCYGNNVACHLLQSIPYLWIRVYWLDLLVQQSHSVVK